MSRTDVHSPLWVKESDPAWRRDFHPEHNHWITEYGQDEPGQRTVTVMRRSVPCDLDVFLTANEWATTRCQMRYRGGRNIFCGCRMCTSHDARKLGRSQDRVIWRKVRQQLLAGRIDGDDVPVIRGSAW